jgi:hypothetical protein
MKIHALFFAGVVLFCSGCITVKMPQYLKDKNPYHKEFYVNYDKTLKATIQALEKMGWKVVKQSNPVVFESDSVDPSQAPKQVILFTDIRQNAMLFGTCYKTLNLIVKESGQKTDVEIRYYFVFSTMFKNFEGYEDDGLARKIFAQIEKVVNVP